MNLGTTLKMLLTFRGVAGFGNAPLPRLLKVELIVALLSAASIVWFYLVALNPVLQTAMSRLPKQGAIRNGALEGMEASPVCLGSNLFLAIWINAIPEGAAKADLMVEFNQAHINLVSRLGRGALHYPADRTISFNRLALPQWLTAPLGSLIGLGILSVILLLVGWALLAVPYAVVAQLVTRQRGQPTAWTVCWRLASAALMPGALCMSMFILLYGLRWLDWRGFMAGFVIHFVAGWIFLFTAPSYLPQAERHGNGDDAILRKSY